MPLDKTRFSNKRRAFTLIEILLTVAVSALLMAAIIPFIRSVNDIWTVSSSKTEILQNGRSALEAVTRYIRQASRITNIPGSSGNYIKMRDQNDTYNIIFYHNVSGSPYYIGEAGVIKNNDLVMRSDQTGSYVDSLFASSLQNLNFDFFKDDGSSAAKANQVKAAKIRMQLNDPLGGSPHTLALEDTVGLRQDVKVSTQIWAINSAGLAPLYDRLAEIANDITADGFRITNAVSNCISILLSDGSCWVADTSNNRIRKVSSDGTILVDLTGFSSPRAVSVNSVLLFNGRETCWVADTGGNRIRRIYWDGSSWVYNTITGFSSPSSVSVNHNEVINGRETCWVADTGGNRIRRVVWTGSAWSYSSAGGITLSMGTGSSPRSICVNPNEMINGRNTCWVACSGTNASNGNRVRKIYWTGTAYTFTANTTVNMGTGAFPRSVSVDTADTINGTCWVANSGTDVNNGNRINKVFIPGMGPQSEPPRTFTGFLTPYSVSVNPNDGTCWVADYGNDQIVRLNSEGDEEFRISGFNNPMAVSVNPNP